VIARISMSVEKLHWPQRWIRSFHSQMRRESPIFTTEHFTVESCSTCYIPGYFILKPRDAVDSLSRMNSAALASLGPTLALITRTIEEVVAARRVYCALFSEETPAIHFHLFPRTEWLTARYFATHPQETEISGPLLMDWARHTFNKPIAGMDRDGIREKIRDRISAGVAKR
jgi:diadenosine tetraphosphate (Ap4A) HIT family hydrolase